MRHLISSSNLCSKRCNFLQMFCVFCFVSSLALCCSKGKEKHLSYKWAQLPSRKYVKINKNSLYFGNISETSIWREKHCALNHKSDLKISLNLKMCLFFFRFMYLASLKYPTISWKSMRTNQIIFLNHNKSFNKLMKLFPISSSNSDVSTSRVRTDLEAFWHTSCPATSTYDRSCCYKIQVIIQK